MKRDRLYLLKPNFMDGNAGPYFCPGCAQMLGLLEFYPVLKEKLEIRFLDFPRPRAELVQLIGEENQSCPVLVLNQAPSGSAATFAVQQANGHWFVTGAEEISSYLAATYGTGIPH